MNTNATQLVRMFKNRMWLAGACPDTHIYTHTAGTWTRTTHTHTHARAHTHTHTHMHTFLDAVKRGIFKNRAHTHTHIAQFVNGNVQESE